MVDELRVEPLGPEHREGYRALMDAEGLGCFCRFWQFEGTKNEWLERSAIAPEQNEAEAFVDPAADDARGLVALRGDRVVGWVKIAPTLAVPKVLRQSVYKALPLADAGVHAIVCFLVHPDERGRGVARALVQAAPDFARAHGARALQAYPRRASYRLPDAQAFAGPDALFVAEGFEVVHDLPPYPVLQKDLTDPPAKP